MILVAVKASIPVKLMKKTIFIYKDINYSQLFNDYKKLCFEILNQEDINYFEENLNETL
jgi:hypothetical protein